MSKKGGYAILDLQNKKLDSGTTILIDKELYEKFVNIYNTKKLVLVSGLVIDDEDYPDVFTSINISDNSYSFFIKDNSVIGDNTSVHCFEVVATKTETTYSLSITEISLAMEI